MPLDPNLDPIIEAAAKEHNVHPALLRSLIMTESGGNPRSISPQGAQGIMQLMPSTARELGVTDPFDPTQAIPAGARYLAQGLDKYNDPHKALMYYHGGPNEQIWGPKTQAYPNTVAKFYGQLTGGTPAKPTGIEALSNVSASRTGGVPAGTPGAAAPISAAAARAMNAADPNQGQHLPVMSSDFVFGKGMVGAPGAGSVKPSGVDALAQAGQRPAANAAPAGGEAIPTDAELMELLKTYKPPSAAAGAPSAPGPTVTPPASAAMQERLAVPLADPANAMYPSSMIPELMKFPAGVSIAQQLQKFTEQGYQLNKDGTLSPVKGGPHDPALLQQNRTAEAIGAARQTQGPGGVIQPLPGSVESDAAKTEAVAASQKLLRPGPDGTFQSAPGVDKAEADRAGSIAKADAQARADVATKSELVEATIDMGNGRLRVMKVPRSALLEADGQPAGGGALTSPNAGPGTARQAGTPYLPPATEAGFRTLSEADAKNVDATRQAAAAGEKDIAVIRTIQDFLPKVATGWGAEAKLEAARILKAAGISESLINDFLKTDVAAGQLLSKNFLTLSSAAARNMGAREPGSVISMFSKAYPSLGTDEQAIKLQTNALYMDRLRSLAEADSKAQHYHESLTLHQQDPTKYRGLTGHAAAFNKEHSPELYLHAAEAMSGAGEAWKGAKTPEQRAAIYNLIPSGTQFLDPSGQMRVKP